jgi:hypothetical protein
VGFIFPKQEAAEKNTLLIAYLDFRAKPPLFQADSYINGFMDNFLTGANLMHFTPSGGPFYAKKEGLRGIVFKLDLCQFSLILHEVAPQNRST